MNTAKVNEPSTKLDKPIAKMMNVGASAFTAATKWEELHPEGGVTLRKSQSAPNLSRRNKLFKIRFDILPGIWENCTKIIPTLLPDWAWQIF